MRRRRFRRVFLPNYGSRRCHLNLRGPEYCYDVDGWEYRKFYWWGRTWYGRFVNGETPWWRTGRNLLQEAESALALGFVPRDFTAEAIRGLILNPVQAAA